MTASSDDNRIVIPGANSVPRHIFEKTIGKGCYSVMEKKVNKFARFQPRYRSFSWTDNDAIYERTLETAFDLDDIDDRASSSLSHGAYRQQGVGVIPPTKAKREALGLKDPMDDPQTVGGQHFDSLYRECLDAITDCMLEGPMLAFGKQALKSARAHVVVKKTSMKGAPKCWHGSDASTTFQKDVLLQMMDSKEGLFTFAYKDDYFVTVGERAQEARMIMQDQSYVPKYRDAAIFRNKEDNGVVLGKTYDPDAHVGKRVRHVFNMPMITNMALMTVNAFLTDYISPKMEKIFKHTPDSMQDLVGSVVHCTDFSAFDTTVPTNVRHYVAEKLYSKEVADIAKAMDRYPIAGVYTDGTKDEVQPYFYIIDRTDPLIAEQFSPLTSGTGDTAVMGKVLGFGDQLRRICLLADMTPRKALAVGDPNDLECLAVKAARNQGDDAATMIDPIAYAIDEKRETVALRHVELMETHKLFDVELEVPGKMIGYKIWTNDYTTGECWAVTHDVTAMHANNAFREHGYNSPLRADEVVGLSSSIRTYESTLRPVMGADLDAFIDRLLYVTDCPYDLDTLHIEADRRMESPEAYIEAKYAEGVDDSDGYNIDDVDDSRKADYARVKLAELFNLSKPDELDWKISRKELIENSPKELLDHIAIIIDPKLTTDATKFLNI